MFSADSGNCGNDQISKISKNNREAMKVASFVRFCKATEHARENLIFDGLQFFKGKFSDNASTFKIFCSPNTTGSRQNCLNSANGNSFQSHFMH